MSPDQILVRSRRFGHATHEQTGVRLYIQYMSSTSYYTTKYGVQGGSLSPLYTWKLCPSAVVGIGHCSISYSGV